jgi:hypothetical protein
MTKGAVVTRPVGPRLMSMAGRPGRKKPGHEARSFGL